ncbi:Odorant receptor 49b [Trachymyrmex septentrionalis]|uniref:Odorant receptor 49b n=1 Tax=Trachymyrmex septentrionalis TaxID=34720 RepID=A0A195F181_9HYME|nr:Odorant receptor 49b [Trachymyrmex septentrionalis]
MKNVKKDKFLSIRLVRFLMRVTGFWPAESETEKRLLNGVLSYTICISSIALWIEATEVYLGKGDFYALTYTACSSMPVIIIMLKIIFFFRYRKELLNMLKYTQDNFWYVQYDEYGSKILEKINKKGLILMCTFTFFVQGTVCTYILTPILENIGKNESDRILPFNVWIGISTTVSPNFEIMFTIEISALIHCGICFCCFDNLLGLLNLHTAGQFKILQHRLRSILMRVERTGTVRLFNEKQKQKVYEKLRECIILHHELIWYSEKMEQIFMYSTLCQLLVSGIMLCVAGFQVFLARGTLIRRLIFIAHTNGCFVQLFVVTLTATDLINESRAVGDAAYNANWQVLSHEENRGVRTAVLMIIMRSARACSISAGGFFPVSLETFMAVLSTAASYFTLLRKFYRSVNITRLFMKVVGLWYVETPKERLLLRVVFGYTVWAIVWAILVEGVDLYHCIGDFYAVTSNLCATLLLIMILVKLGSFMFYRDMIMDLIHFAEKNFWGVTYDETSAQILEEYDKLGMTMIYTFTFMVYTATFNYIFAPFFEPQEKNETEKVLPFKLWIDFPYHSPYYEITYTIQSLSTMHSGICTFCFDNFVSTFNIHAAAQLKILAHKVEVIAEHCIGDTTDQKRPLKTDVAVLMFKKLRDCVKQHLTLICYVRNMQRVFAIILLGQLLLSSVVICFGGFQFLATDVIIRKCIFAFHFVGGLIQLLIYTWTCNDIIVQSTAISDAAYNSKWYLLPDNDLGRAVKRGLITIMIRARRPCILTAGNFTVISLDTFMGVSATQ